MTRDERALARLSAALDAGIRRKRPPYQPPATVRELRYVAVAAAHAAETASSVSPWRHPGVTP